MKKRSKVAVIAIALVVLLTFVIPALTVSFQEFSPMTAREDYDTIGQMEWNDKTPYEVEVGEHVGLYVNGSITEEVASEYGYGYGDTVYFRPVVFRKRNGEKLDMCGLAQANFQVGYEQWNGSFWEPDASGTLEIKVEAYNDTKTIRMGETGWHTIKVVEPDVGMKELTIFYTGPGIGDMYGNGIFIDITPEKSSYSSPEFEEGTEVIVEALQWQSDDASFDHWEGDVSGTSRKITITMDSDKEIKAVYEKVEEPTETYGFTSTSTSPAGVGGISFSPDKEVYEKGTEVEITAEKDAGYVFSHWESNVLSGTSRTITVIMDETGWITAHYNEKEIPKYDLTVKTVSGRGDIAIDPDKDAYEEGEKVTLVAEPAEKYGFWKWGGDVTGSKSTVEVTMDSDKTVETYFEEKVEMAELNLEATPSEGGSVTVDPKTVVEVGTHVDVSVSVSENYRFVKWTGNTESIDDVASPNITVPMNEDRNLLAHFEEKPKGLFPRIWQSIRNFFRGLFGGL